MGKCFVHSANEAPGIMVVLYFGSQIALKPETGYVAALAHDDEAGRLTVKG